MLTERDKESLEDGLVQVVFAVMETGNLPAIREAVTVWRALRDNAMPTTEQVEASEREFAYIEKQYAENCGMKLT